MYLLKRCLHSITLNIYNKCIPTYWYTADEFKLKTEMVLPVSTWLSVFIWIVTGSELVLASSQAQANQWCKFTLSISSSLTLQQAVTSISNNYSTGSNCVLEDIHSHHRFCFQLKWERLNLLVWRVMLLYIVLTMWNIKTIHGILITCPL